MLRLWQHICSVWLIDSCQPTVMCEENFGSHLLVTYKYWQFNYFKVRGMVPAALGLASVDNLITLCPNCHAAYDIELPYWVIVPHVSILDSYLRHERGDYRHRIAAAARGDTVRRTLSVIDKENALYYKFIMEPVTIYVK